MTTTLGARPSSARWILLRGIVAFAATAGMVAPQLRAQERVPTPTDTPTVNMPVPASVYQLQAHEVVARIISQRHELLLSDAQFEELQGLHRAVTEERAIYESTVRAKPPYQRPVWITTPEQALARAFTILTPHQRHASLMLFAKQG